MGIKEYKARQYANSNYSENDWQTVAEDAFKIGWDEALKNQWISVDKKRPKLYDKILVLYKLNNSYRINETKYFGFVTNWKFGGSDVIAWMPIPLFDNVIKVQ